MGEWREERRELNRGARFVAFWVLGIVAAVTLIGVLVWLFSVAVSGPKGQGDAVIERNSAANWTAAQARFEKNYAEIVATDRKVTLAWEQLQASPDDLTLQQTYSGTVAYCISVVADYNADARSYLREDFRAADLPEQISELDPTTDCKE